MSKIVLNPLQHEDLSEILLWRNHPDTRKNMYHQHIIKNEEHENWFQLIQKNINSQCFICERNKKKIGFIGYSNINFVNQSADWAFYLNPLSRKGSGAIMEFVALEYGFKELNLKLLRCEVMINNEPVIKLHTKFGFEIIATKNKYIQDTQQYFEIVEMILTSETWKNKRNILADKIGLQELL